ncbi:MAG: DinB family protein [Thermoanaerobaculia bacterium]
MNENGRPDRDETSAYYHKYIDLVPDGDITVILEEQGREVLAFLSGVSPSRASHRYAPDKWSVADVLGHINDTERLFTMRAFWFARGFESALPGYEPEVAARMAAAGDRPWERHIREFASVRAATVDFFRNLPSDAWQRRGVASDNPFTVRALAHIAAGHVIHHVSILKERYL